MNDDEKKNFSTETPKEDEEEKFVLTSSPSFCANGSRCSCSMYFSRLKNVSKKIAVILQRFKSVSVMQSRLLGLIMSSICGVSDGKLINWNNHGSETKEKVILPDTGSLRTVTFQFQAAPFDAVALHRSIPTHTSKGCRHRQCPCIGTNTRWPWHDFYLLQQVGTKRSRCMTFAKHFDRFEHSDALGHASHIPKIFSQSFATRELCV